MGTSPRPARAGCRAAVLAALLAWGSASGGLASPAAEPDELPAAAFLDKVVWSSSPDLTRLTFRAGRRVSPRVERTRADLLRVDLTAVGADAIPSRLEVGTRQVRSVSVLPAAIGGLLPPDVSARFLVVLADPSAEWGVEESAEGFSLFIGAAAKVRRTTRVESALGGSWIDRQLEQAAVPEEPPTADERLSPNVPFRVLAPQSVRGAPSALAPIRETVGPGDARIADARRDNWVHLVSGGWLQHALPAPGDPETPTGVPVGTVKPPRSGGAPPAAWSVLTLGTGLAVEVRDLNDEEAAAVLPLHGLFAEPVRIVAWSLAARGSRQYSFRFPPKEGRVRLVLADGRSVGSLDPREVPRVAEMSEDDFARAFPTPEIGAGQAWTGLLLLPPEAELGAAESVFVNVGDREHRLFKVPAASPERP